MTAIQAQSLIAGWSFTNVSGGASGSITADLSDPLLDGAGGTINSAIYFNGDFGSTDIFGNGGGGVVYDGINDAGLASNADITTRPSAQDFQAGGSLDDALRIENFAALPFGNFVFEIDGSGTSYQDWSFSYAAGGGTFDINWAWSTNGSTYNPFGSDTVDGADTAGSFSGFGSATDTLYLQASFTGFATDNIGGEQLFLDNFAVYGTAVPEPSSFAAIAGVMALAFVAARRRK